MRCESKWNIVFFMRDRLGLTSSFGRCGGIRNGSRSWTRGLGWHIAIRAFGIKKRKAFQNHTELAALLASLFIIPLIETKPAFNQDRTALLEVLGNDFGLPAKRVHIHKGDLLFGFTSFVLPGAIDGEANFTDGEPLRRVAKFGVTGQIARKNYSI